MPAVDALEMTKTVLKAAAAKRAKLSLWKELSPNCPLLAATYRTADTLGWGPRTENLVAG